MPNILIVEDDKAIANLIQLNLTVAGYQSERAHSGHEAELALEGRGFDLILLDVMLPDMDGFILLEKIKPQGTPVIFLTARNRLEDKVRGLTGGAEDYIVKPFEAVELLARIEVILRRCRRGEEKLTFADLEIDPEERTVKKQGRVIEMTPKEYELFLLLLHNRNKALSREKILEMVWGYDYWGETRTVDIHIQKLRKKLELGDKLKTVYKFGYRLENGS